MHLLLNVIIIFIRFIFIYVCMNCRSKNLKGHCENSMQQSNHVEIYNIKDLIKEEKY